MAVPKKRKYKKYIPCILVWYVLAKIAEHFDHQIFETTGFWSGHTIKHLLGAIALYFVISLLAAWEQHTFLQNPQLNKG